MPEKRELNKDKLYELHVEQGLSGRQIASELDCANSTAIKYLRRHGIYDKEQAYGDHGFGDGR